VKPSFSSFSPPAFLPQKLIRIGAALDNQADAARALPSIQSPSIPTNAEIGPQGLFFQTIEIKPGQKYPVQLKGNYVYIEGIRWSVLSPTALNSITKKPVTVSSDTLPAKFEINDPSSEIRWPTPFNFLEFENRNVTETVNLQIWCGFGAIRKDPLKNLTWSGAQSLYIGPPVVIPQNYTLSGEIGFTQATSKVLQTATVKAASVSRSGNLGAPIDCSLWLFSDSGNYPGINQPFQTLPPLLQFRTSNALGKIKFSNAVSGAPGVSNTDFVFVENLNLPIFHVGDWPANIVWAVAVADAAYTTAALEEWNFVLKIEYA
jgi:hypothetical protein